MSKVKLLFDAAHAEKLFSELSLRLEAFDSFESIPSYIREMVSEFLAGRGFEFTYHGLGTTLPAGERFIKVEVGGKLNDALSALRAMQGKLGINHVGSPES